MYHIPLFAIAEGIVVSIMALVFIGLAIHVARSEEGLNKWVILFGMFVMAVFLIGIGYLSISSQVVEVFSK